MKEPTEAEIKHMKVAGHLGGLYYKQKSLVAEEIIKDATARVTYGVRKGEQKEAVERLIGALTPKEEEKPTP